LGNLQQAVSKDDEMFSTMPAAEVVEAARDSLMIGYPPSMSSFRRVTWTTTLCSFSCSPARQRINDQSGILKRVRQSSKFKGDQVIFYTRARP
jgi:hypothetical protein